MTVLTQALTLHGWSTSPFCQKTLLALDHKQLQFAWAPAPMLKRSALMAHTGSNQVPVLQCGDTWISDSTRIAAWLEEHASGPALYPTESHQRALSLLIEDWADEVLAVHSRAAYWCPPGNARRLLAGAAVERPMAETRLGSWLFERVAPRMFKKIATSRRSERASREVLGQQLDVLDAMLTRTSWLVADRPSIADYGVAGQLINLLELEDATYFAARPRLRSWLLELASRLPARCLAGHGQTALLTQSQRSAVIRQGLATPPDEPR